MLWNEEEEEEKSILNGKNEKFLYIRYVILIENGEA